MLPRAATLAVIAIIASGCAAWKQEERKKPGTELPRARMSPDSVLIDVAFVRVPADLTVDVEKLWNEADEQHFSLEKRRLLNENGFRCGISGSVPSEDLGLILEHAENDPSRLLEAGQPGKTVVSSLMRFQSHAAKKNKIVMTEPANEMVVMVRENDNLQGITCRLAHCEFSLRSYPLGDGRVRVQLKPEVYHGEPKQTVVAGENAFRFDTSQKCLDFDNLQIEATLSSGQMLILSTTEEPRGLGAQFFQDSKGIDAHPKLLVLRVAQTQLDDAFAPDEILTPIATPME